MTAKPLVAAADGSEESLRAVKWAAREAVLRDAPLRIVAAASPPPRMFNLLALPGCDFMADLAREDRGQALAAAATRAAAVSSSLQVDTVPLAARRRRRSPKADPARRCWLSELRAPARWGR